MSSLLGLVSGWRFLAMVLVVFGFAPGAVLRLAVRAYPKNHPRRRELLAELYALGYLERPLFVAQQMETAAFEGLPARWRQRREQVVRLSLIERLEVVRRRYLLLPDERVAEFLGEDEYVVHSDHPSFRAFLQQNIALLVLVPIVGPTFVWFMLNEIILAAIAFFLLLDVVLVILALRRLDDRYVSYVITNLRVMRVTGVFRSSRKLASVPWARITGLGYRQKPMGRLLAYATIFIDAADEESGLRAFSDVNDPITFHQLLLDMVSVKSGQKVGPASVPTLGKRCGFLARRRERKKTEATTVKGRTCPSWQQGESCVRRSSGGRLDTWRRKYLPLPNELIDELLLEGEKIVHSDHPMPGTFLDPRVFLEKKIVVATLISILGAVLVWPVSVIIAAILFLVPVCLVVTVSVLRHLGDRYSTYVITDHRLMRMTGIFSRKLASIALTKITNLSDFRQDDAGGHKGNATIVIEAANEKSGLREIVDLNDPEAFHQRLQDALLGLNSGR